MAARAGGYHIHVHRCLAPTSPWCRLASWGVVLGPRHTEAFHSISNGLVPGWVQTATRAEIHAVLSAFEFALRVHKPFALWVDNDRVYKKLRHFQRGYFRITSNQKDADLWIRLRCLYSHVGPLLVHVGKVVSHQNPEGAADEAESWIFGGNSAADSVAASAYHRFPELLQSWKQLYQDLANVSILRDQIHKVFVNVGQKSFTKPAERKDRPTAPARVERADVQLLAPTRISAQDLPRRWHFAEGQQVVDWLISILDEAAPSKFLSWFQLNALFEHQTQLPGITYKPSCKRYLLATRTERKNLVKRANHFSRWVQGTYPQCKVLHVRPHPTTISFWTMCVNMKVKQYAVEIMDQLLSQHQATYTQVRQLCAI